MRKLLRGLLASFIFGVTGVACAGTINFTYTGTDPTCATCTENGSGSFSFAGSPLSINLGDLTAFSLVNVYTDTSPPPFSETYAYGLLDVSTFAATLDAAQNVTALSFETTFVYPSDTVCGFLCSLESIKVSSLNSATTSTCSSGLKGGCPFIVFQNTQGSIATSVPEPPTLALLIVGFGFAGIGYVGHRYERRIKRPSAVTPNVA